MGEGGGGGEAKLWRSMIEGWGGPEEAKIVWHNKWTAPKMPMLGYQLIVTYQYWRVESNILSFISNEYQEKMRWNKIEYLGVKPIDLLSQFAVVVAVSKLYCHTFSLYMSKII